MKASVIGRKRSAIAFAYVCAATYAGLFGKQTAGTITFLLMSPQPPYVLEPTLAMVAMTVLRLPLRTPWSWKACRVVARRSPCPYLLDSSSSSR